MMAATTTAAAAAAQTSTTTTRVLMEKPSQEQIQQQQQPLKCPRCESTNTKFCYYNNYSLSQPRYFCKSCKRYWTRGGTLRNVPVGGGSKKNKRVRVRRPTSNSSSSSSASNNSSINETNTFISSHESNLNPSASGIINGGGGGHGAHLINPMLYGLPTNLVPHEVISNGFPFSGYDSHHHHHQPQTTLGGLGLGFSSAAAAGILGGGDHGLHGNGFSTPKQILQDLISINSNPSLVSTFHGSCNNTTSTTTTTTTNTTTTTAAATTTSTTTLPTMSMSSLLNSSLQQQQQKFNFRNSLLPYESDIQIKGVGSHGNGEVYTKDDHVKLEKNDDPNHGQPQLIQSGYEIHDPRQQPHMEASDPSILLWHNNNSNGTSIGGNWLDPNFSSIGSSSVPSLI